MATMAAIRALLISLLILSLATDGATARVFGGRSSGGAGSGSLAESRGSQSVTHTISRCGGRPASKSATANAAAASPAATKTSSPSSAVAEGLKNTLASGLAAACSKTILAPFDTIKTVQQHVEGGRSLGLLEASRRVTSRPGGALNLYAGLGVAVVGSIPSVGLYFGVYSYCKRTIGPWLQGCFGSESGRGEGGRGVCPDGALKNISIMCSAAIGAFMLTAGAVHCA